MELPGIPVVFHTTSKAEAAVYDTQDCAGAGSVAEYAFARDSATGEPDDSGNGHVNFRVLPAEGYRVQEIRAEPAEHFKNLKGPEDTGGENRWRITKITGRVDVTVRLAKNSEDEEPPAPPCTHEFDEAGVCVLCGEAAPRAFFACGGHASVRVFDTQDLSTEGRLDPDYAPPEPPEPPEPPFRFDDVRDESAYYFKPVYWALNHDPRISAGVTETLFGPKQSCTRGQVIPCPRNCPARRRAGRDAASPRPPGSAACLDIEEAQHSSRGQLPQYLLCCL